MKDALLYPQVKNAVAIIARIGIVALWAGFIISLLGTIISLTLLYGWENPYGFSVRIISGHVAHIFTLLFTICLGLLFPWCHQVLLFQRGWALTRDLSWASIAFSLFILITELLELSTGIHIFPKQALAPFIMLCFMAGITLVNLPNMAALGTMRLIGLMLSYPLLILCLLLGFIYEPMYSCAMRLLLLLCLLPLLKSLQQNAQRIIALPPLEG